MTWHLILSVVVVCFAVIGVAVVLGVLAAHVITLGTWLD